MSVLQKTMSGILAGAVVAAAASITSAQPAAETFSGTATMKTASGATASAPLTITVARKNSQSEADALIAAFKTGGVAGLRKALAGAAPTGSVRLGGGEPTPTRVTIERTTDKGRLLTIVTDQPIAFLGAGLPAAKAKQGYDFGIIDIEVGADGKGSGTIAPAAKVTVKQGAFTVEDYASELVRVTDVSKVK